MTYRSLTALALLALLLLFGASSRIHESSQPFEPEASTIDLVMFRGNPERNLSAVGTVPRRPKLLWRFQTKTKYEGRYERRRRRGLTAATRWQGLGWTGQPVRLGDRIYFGSTDSYVYCVDAATGAEIWHYPNHHSIKGSVMIHDGCLYHGGRDNKLHCCTLDGDMIWQTRTGNDIDSSPAIVNGRGYVGTEDGHIVCFDPHSGDILWKRPAKGSVESSVCVVGGRVFAGCDGGVLYCRDTESGDEVWTFNTGGDTDSTPVHFRGRVYVGSPTRSGRVAGRLWCIDAATGDMIWKARLPRGVWASPAVNPDRGRVYIGCNNGVLYCFDADTGDLVWKRHLGSRIWSSAAVTDGCVVVGVRDGGTLWCLNEDDGSPIWAFDDGFDIDATPCVAGGMIVVGSQNGWVYGIGEAPEYEPINPHWFRTSEMLTQPTDHDPTGIPTIYSSAPAPRTWRDTHAGCTDNLYYPVRAPAP